MPEKVENEITNGRERLRKINDRKRNKWIIIIVKLKNSKQEKYIPQNYLLLYCNQWELEALVDKETNNIYSLPTGFQEDPYLRHLTKHKIAILQYIATWEGEDIIIIIIIITPYCGRHSVYTTYMTGRG